MSSVIKTLAIETSCDDTSLAIVSWDGFRYSCEHILAYSQVEHQQYGGVVPEIASRLHEQKIISVLSALEKYFSFDDIDCISVTATPGLPGSLLVGKTVAQFLSTYHHKPLQYVNHIQGHIYSALLDRDIDELHYPAIVLTVSGGHNDMYLIDNNRQIKKLGATLDDAAGEAFDKVSRMLGGPYPGGPRVSEQATHGQIDRSLCKRLLLPDQPYQFSFSGIKSSVHHWIQKKKNADSPLTDGDIASICATFQDSVGYTLAYKVAQAVREYDAKSVMFVGGVSANESIREMIKDMLPSHVVFFSPIKKVYCTDNAAMIGLIGLMQHRGESLFMSTS